MATPRRRGSGGSDGEADGDGAEDFSKKNSNSNTESTLQSRIDALESTLTVLKTSALRENTLRQEHFTALEALFEMTPRPDDDRIQHLASSLNVAPQAVLAWFRNRRVETKRSIIRQRKINACGTIAFLLAVVLAVLYARYDPAEIARARRLDARKARSSRV